MPAPSPRFSVILGMHRSGTSLLAQALSVLGFFPGLEDELLPPNFDNPQGFFEHRELVAINDAILELFGGTWLQPPAWPQAWTRDPRLEALRQRAQLFLAERFAGQERVLLKDPRLCLTLPFWAPLLGDWQALLCTRQPSAIVASLHERHGLPEAYATWLWASYTQSALEHARGRWQACLRYEDLRLDLQRALLPWSGSLALPQDLNPLTVLARRDLDHGALQEGPWDLPLARGTEPAHLAADLEALGRRSAEALQGPLPTLNPEALALARLLPEHRALQRQVNLERAAYQGQIGQLLREQGRLGARIGRVLGRWRQRLSPDGSPQNRLFTWLGERQRQGAGLAPKDLRARLRAIHFARPEQPRISVLVPMYGQAGLTLDCLEALQRCAKETDLEVLLIDDASPGQAGDPFARLQGLRYVKNPENLGYLRSCNKLAMQARGEFLLLLNNDTRVQAGALSALLRVFEARPDAGLVGAKFLYPDGRLQEAGAQVFADGSAAKRGQGLEEGEARFERFEESDYCSGAGLLIRRKLFLELGGYDEHFLPSHYEDVDLAFEVRQRGLKVYYQPEARIVHVEGATCGPAGPLNHTELNRPKFRQKWAAVLDAGRYPSAQRGLKGA